MKRFKNLLVYLPGTIVEDNIVNWVTTITEKAESESVHFITSFQGYEHLMSEEEWGKFSADVAREWYAESPFKNYDVDVSYTAYRRPGLTALLENMATGDYDLVILPREHQEGLSFVERAVRKSTTGVLVIPKDTEPDFSSIMLSVDFGDLSTLALDWAEAFASIAEPPPVLKALHVMQMPTQSRALALMDPDMVRNRIFATSSTNLKDFIAEKAKKENDWEQMIAENPLPSVQILEEAKMSKSKLLVIGSHGKNAFSTALLGGESIDLIRECEIPLLVVKKKNETLGFVKHLLGVA